MRSIYNPRYKLDHETKQRILQTVSEYERGWKKQQARKSKFTRFLHLSFQSLAAMVIIFLLIKSPLLEELRTEEESQADVEAVSDGLVNIKEVLPIVQKNEVLLKNIETTGVFQVRVIGGSLVSDDRQGALAITVYQEGQKLYTDYYKTNVKHGELTVYKKDNSSVRIVAEDGMEWGLEYSGSYSGMEQRITREETEE
jgi:hypothetical protein